MNKKLCLTLLPLLGLVSCATNETQDVAKLFYTNGVPTIQVKDSTHVTYLMLSPFGEISGYQGNISTKGAVSELFYENTVILQAEPGTALPDATQVTSIVDGATFRGWFYYDESNDHVYPDKYETVQATDGLALKAIFDGTNASGGGGGGQGGGGGGEQGPKITYQLTNFEDWTPNDGAKVFAWGWGPGNGGEWYTVELNMEGTDHNYSNVTGTFFAPDNLEGFNLARCPAGTTAPDWKTTGDSNGRIYNKTEDVTVRAGTTIYQVPVWQQYNPQ